MVELDTFFRFAGIAMLLVQAGLLFRDARDVRPARFGIVLSLTLAAVLAVEAPASSPPPTAPIAALMLVSSNGAVAIWWFCRSLFDDNFRLRTIEWSLAALWFGLGVFNYADYVAHRPISVAWASAARSAIALFFIGHVVWTALVGRKTDLVEGRRRVRTVFAFVISALFLLDLGGEVFFGYLETPDWANTFQHGAYFLVICWSFFWFGRADKTVLMFDRAPVVLPPPAPTLSAKEEVLRRRLIEVMETEKAYLDPELSIGALAARIGAPEHQLRALINMTMGHRNFRAFLNEYRMAAIKADLADPAKASLPILTIAMDGGFASLSSFNRAFKEATEMTPSAWREAALARQNAGQN